MLEIKHITKIYRSKTGENVKALDGIDLSFPDRGMVIILGKSGSGKSTLLNVIGGLDSFDEGELLIKGRSSRDFAGSDFDAYRNTFIGFIFQEYNILEDFSVGANIGLALELQGKKATNESISEILRRVDLIGYADRKPNELSGGQKQRVAIARALVKDPEIIMADEPTGALDSNTGKAIFDTLKELSKEKLVIVVSHDRDFAEKYADRIVELSDGHILSDVTREAVEGQEVSDGIRRISDNLLRIKSGYELTEEDVRMINEYLRTHEEDLLLSGDEKINEGIRQSAGMLGSEEASVFKDTGNYRNGTFYNPQNTRFIRSRLPMKNALKMGASGFRHKTFRLILTILLAVVSFTLFGLADTMAAFNKYRSAADSIRSSKIENASFSLSLKNTYQYDEDEEPSVYYESTLMNDADIAYLREQTGLSFLPVYLPTHDYSYSYSASAIEYISIMKDYAKIKDRLYYRGQLSGITSISAIADSGLSLVAGKLPEAEGEILITKLVFEQLKLAGIRYPDDALIIEPGKLVCSDTPSENNIIGMTLPDTVALIGGYRIVGVIDTAFDSAPYEGLNIDDYDTGKLIEYLLLSNELCDLLDYGYHELAFVTDSELEKIAKKGRVNSNFGTRIITAIVTASYTAPGADAAETVWFDSIADCSYLDALTVHYFDGCSAETLNTKGCLISDWNLAMLLGVELEELTPEVLASASDIVFSAFTENWEWEEVGFGEVISKAVRQDLSIGAENMKVIGYYESNCTDYGYGKVRPENGSVILSPVLLAGYRAWYASDIGYSSTTVAAHDEGFYPFALAPMSKDPATIKKLVDLNYREGDDLHFSMENQVMSQLNSFSEIIEELAKVFVWIGVGFAVFSSLLLMNFISISISYKKHEIGILRAVGARSSDVFKIFFSESMIIAAINFVLSVAATVIAVISINRAMMEEGIRVTLLSLGIRQIFLMLLISVFVAAVASFLPVWRIARKKPVDAIKGR